MINDLDLSNWKELDILTDDLWLFANRDKSGKHKNIYHGNFIPQIPYQLISRFTKAEDIVLDAFCGSGTTLYECEKLGRKFIGLDLNQQILDFVSSCMKESKNDFYSLILCDNTSKSSKILIQNSINKFSKNYISLAIFHPPYFDIVKFSDNPKDLSNSKNIDDFLDKLLMSFKNCLEFLKKNGYFALVIGDIYKNSEVVPLSFLCMDMIKRNFKVKLKGILVKNIEGNRGKLGSGGIWHYRALKSDYYIFKHEYIFVFKKEF